MPIDAQELIDYQEELDSERDSWAEVWEECQDLVCPNRPSILDEDDTEVDKSVDVYDSTPVRASERLSASLGSMLTNPSTEWVRIQSGVEAVNQNSLGKNYMKDLNDTLMLIYDMSNLYTEMNILYQDLTVIGTACMYIERGPTLDEPILFSTRHMKEIFIDENKNGQVDTVFRRFHMTGRQLRQCVLADKEYVINKTLRDRIDNDPRGKIEFIHAVYPREDFSGGSPKLRMKFASVYIAIDEKFVVKESGYQMFPYLVPRWIKSAGDVYGRSPALSNLADIKTLNEMVKTLVKTGQRIADPVLMAPDDGFFNIDTEPGGISFYRAGATDRIETLKVGENIGINFQMIKELRDRIADAFLMSQMMIIDKKDMTAEEVRARVQEQLRALGPVAGRLQQELLSPLVKTSVYMLKPVLPKIPPQLKEIHGRKPPKFIYVSPMAKAQKLADAQSVISVVNTALDWAARSKNPAVLDNIDSDEALRVVQDASGAPPSIMLSAEAVEALRAQRQQAAQAAAQQQKNLQTTEAMTNVADAYKNAATGQERMSEV